MRTIQMLCTGENSLIYKYLVVLFLIVFASQSFASEDGTVLIQNGFIKGNEFRVFDNGSKNIYSMGLVDGILLSPLYGVRKSNMGRFEDCTAGMNGSQLTAIFDKYLAAHPERWHQGMHILAFVALKESCGS
ncbi:hypothetical protein GCM10007978_08340 [Shewanella hanedai]|uniref:Rap1a immunity protein domain-containing protein n=1 Tax=Shewanella hanedai TaxID=25 RepID=A0A553JSA0_SHEHA|nr:hypothetical protein [Shewanella hanedai]TRY15320.1 hypothetical protein FN961_06540 [Shewanella hanedai]GGI72860.1 hypothetical protein GCM10007978_08340 [Shewanella hanedai]